MPCLEITMPKVDTQIKAKLAGELTGAFDKATNRSIREVCAEEPEIFEGWASHDLEELYSTFGMGGALSREGVRTAAERINRKRTVIQQLQIVLETHLGEVAEGLIGNLFAMVQAEQSELAQPTADSIGPPHSDERE